MSGHSRSLMEPTPEERAALDAIDRGVTCPACDGTGATKSPGGMKRRCQRCNGSGWVLAEPDTSQLLTHENEARDCRSTLERVERDIDNAKAQLVWAKTCLARAEAAHRADLEPKWEDVLTDMVNDICLADVLETLRDICEQKQSGPAIGTLGGEPLRVASAWAHATASLAQMAKRCREDGL